MNVVGEAPRLASTWLGCQPDACWSEPAEFPDRLAISDPLLFRTGMIWAFFTALYVATQYGTMKFIASNCQEIPDRCISAQP